MVVWERWFAPAPMFAALRKSASGHCRPTRAPRNVCNRQKRTSTPGPAPHTPPHRPRHAACRTDMWRAVRNSSRKSMFCGNGTSPLAPPTYIAGFSSYLDEQARASPYWVHCVLLGSLLTTVAVQPGRCRRFIGTLLARIKYAPPTLRMEDKERRSESLVVDRENKIVILRKTISRSISRERL